MMGEGWQCWENGRIKNVLLDSSGLKGQSLHSDNRRYSIQLIATMYLRTHLGCPSRFGYAHEKTTVVDRSMSSSPESGVVIRVARKKNPSLQSTYSLTGRSVEKAYSMYLESVIIFY